MNIENGNLRRMLRAGFSPWIFRIFEMGFPADSVNCRMNIFHREQSTFRTEATGRQILSRAHIKRKLLQYEKIGIVPWDNLIVTYSDRNANVDVRIIESEIKNRML